MPDAAAASPAPPPEVGADLIDSREAGPAAIRGSALRAVGFFGGLLFTLGSAPLLFRHLGVVEFGRYLTVLSLVTVAAGLTEGGLNAIALREYATRAGADRGAVLANVLGLRGLLSAAALLGAVGFGFIAGYDRALILGTALAGVGMSLQVLQTLMSVALQGDLRFGWATVLELVRQGVLAGSLIVLVLAGAGLLPLLAAQIPAGIAALAFTLPLIRGRMPLRPRLDRHVWWPLLRDTLPYSASITLNIVYFRLAILVMSLVSSGRQTGYFATSFRIMEVLIGVLPVIVAASFPILARAARDDPERFAYATRRLLEVALIGGVWITICIELGAGLAIHLLAGAKFGPAAPVLRIQGPAVIGTFVAVAATYPLLSLAAHRQVLVANLGALVSSAAVLAALISAQGARGAAVATLVAEVILGLISLSLLVRARPGVGLRPRAVAVVAVGAGAALAVAALPLPVPVEILVATAVYAVVLRLAGLFPTELAHAVMRR